MKKIFIFFIFIFPHHKIFSQNSSETNLSGTTPIIRATGFGSMPTVPFTHKTAILGHTNATSSSSSMSGVFGYATNSTATNYGVYGAAGGTGLESIGIYGRATLTNGKGAGIEGIVSSSSIGADFMYGGNFLSIPLSGVNGSAVSYGLSASSSGTGAISSSYGINTNSNSNVSVVSVGISSISNSSGIGNEFGGFFDARGTATGALKIGIQAKSSGVTTVSNRYGVEAISNGPASSLSYGVNGFAENSANGQTYGGYFKAQGSGTGPKWGIYATAAGSGNLYAAALIGKVGINTEIPSDALTVYTPTGNTGIVHTDGTIQVSTYVGVGAGWIGTKSNHPLNFYTNDGTEQMRLLQNGNFGIGINPTEKLHVSGNIKATGSLLGSALNVTTANVTNITATGNVNSAYSTVSNDMNIGDMLTTDKLKVGAGGAAIFEMKRVNITSQQIFGIVNNTCDLQYFTVNGVQTNDNIILNIDNLPSTLVIGNVRASNTNQIEVKFCNIGTSNTVLFTGLTFRIMYYR